MAVVQIRHQDEGRAYCQPRLAAGKTHMEAGLSADRGAVTMTGVPWLRPLVACSTASRHQVQRRDSGSPSREAKGDAEVVGRAAGGWPPGGDPGGHRSL